MTSMGRNLSSTNARTSVSLGGYSGRGDVLIDDVKQILAEAARVLADTAILDAIAESGDPSEIDVAEELFAEGESAVASGMICDVALDKYEGSWEKAVKSWCEEQAATDSSPERYIRRANVRKERMSTPGRQPSRPDSRQP